MIQNDQIKTKSLSTKSGSRVVNKQKLDFLKSNTPLPSIDDFDLEKILSNELKEESEQVVSSLLQIAGDYQDDLRLCIKNKLSIEQRIQFKNIEVAKLVQSINSKLNHNSEKLRKFTNKKGKTSVAENKIDNDIASLLEYSARVSTSVKSLSKRLYSLDKRINGNNPILGSGSGVKKYPTLVRAIKIVGFRRGFDNNDANTDINKLTANAQGSFITSDSSGSISNKSSDLLDEEIEVGNSLENEPQDVGMISKNVNVDLTYPNIELKDHAIERGKNERLNEVEEDGEMDRDEFEMFINTSINKYRQRQEQKYKDTESSRELNSNVDISRDDLSNIKLELVEHNSEKSNSSVVDSPINLLYSPLVSKISSTSLNFSKLGIKSAATVTQSLQISHSKKLRINGSNHTKMPKPPGDMTDDDESNNISLGEHLGEVLGDEEYESYENDYDNLGEMGIEQILSSESSDSDLSGLDSNSLSNTMNKYYYSFKNERKSKNSKLKSLSRDERNTMPSRFFRAISPTLKHQPSHHKLKPMRSILKNKQADQFNDIQKINTSPRRASHDNTDNSLKVSPTRSVISSSHIRKYQLSSLSVAGTIIPVKHSNDNDESIKIQDDRLSVTNSENKLNIDDMDLRSISELKCLLLD